MSDQTTKPRHLRPVPPDAAPPDALADRNWHAEAPQMPPRTTDRPVKLTPTQRFEVEEAREYITGVGQTDTTELRPAQFGYVIGRLQGFADCLLDVIDAITEL